MEKTFAEELSRVRAANAAKAKAKAEGIEDSKSQSKAKMPLSNQMHLSEAKQILDIGIYPNMKPDEIEQITEKYTKLYENNKWLKGNRSSPTYIQSRIYRAKE